MANPADILRGRTQILDEQQKLKAELGRFAAEKRKAEAEVASFKETKVSQIRNLEAGEKHLQSLIDDLQWQADQAELSLDKEHQAAIARLAAARSDFAKFAARFNAGAAKFHSLLLEMVDLIRRAEKDAAWVEQKPFAHHPAFPKLEDPAEELCVIVRCEGAAAADQWQITTLAGARSRNLPIPGFDGAGK